MLLKVSLLLALAGVSVGKDHGSHIGNVDGAIDNIDWHYSDKLCLDLLLVDCTKHTTTGDEEVCGTDGITYPNHCVFVHAVCEFRYSKLDLTVQNHGPCVITTPVFTTTALPTSAPIVSTTSAPPITVTTGGVPVSTTTGGVPVTVTTTVVTAVPTTVTTTGATTTTPSGPTTTNAVHNIIQNVFCINAGAIDCAGSGVDVICATDSVLYPNQCEFAKAHCKNSNLAHADPATCPAPP